MWRQTSGNASEKSASVRMQSRRRAPDLSYKGCVAFAKWDKFWIQGLMYWRQVMRCAMQALSIPVMAAETS